MRLFEIYKKGNNIFVKSISWGIYNHHVITYKKLLHTPPLRKGGWEGFSRKYLLCFSCVKCCFGFTSVEFCIDVRIMYSRFYYFYTFDGFTDS